jgi:hypothetical protein
MTHGLQVHERTLQGDFLMALLKDIIILRRAQGNPLKVSLPQMDASFLLQQSSFPDH